jgi:hypothetical protein
MWYTLTWPVYGRPLTLVVAKSPRTDLVTAVISRLTTVRYGSANIVTDTWKVMLENTIIIVIGDVFTMILPTQHLWRSMSFHMHLVTVK